MLILKTAFRAMGILIMSMCITGIAQANDRDALIEFYRMRQAELGQNMAFNTEKIGILQDLLDQGRTYMVKIPLGDTLQPMLVTRQEAVRAHKTIVLMRAILGRRVLHDDELRKGFSEEDKTATNIAIRLEQDIPRLAKLNRRLQTEWRDLEFEIAEMMQQAANGAPGSSRTGTRTATTDDRVCVQLVETKASDTPLTAGASISPRAATHTVSHRGKVGSKPIDVTLSWSAPPLRLCEGDEFYVKVTATNNAPTSSGLSLHYVGSVGVSGKPNIIETVTCSNPVTWIDVDDDIAVVAPDRSSYTNSCTYKVVNLENYKTPQVLVTAGLGVHTGGAGQVLYSYAAP